MRTRRPSIASLCVRALTGLLTVWCLGCSGYEPLVDSLFGRSSGMSCGDMSSIGSANQDAAQHAVASISDAASDRGFDCGCGSCHAASPQTWTVVLSPAERPGVAASVVIEPVNPTRAPVAPPPQVRA